jgi:hypothetical protein
LSGYKLSSLFWCSNSDEENWFDNILASELQLEVRPDDARPAGALSGDAESRLPDLQRHLPVRIETKGRNDEHTFNLILTAYPFNLKLKTPPHTLKMQTIEGHVLDTNVGKQLS